MHTMHGNMVFSTHYILGTPEQSGGLLVCSVICIDISEPGVFSDALNLVFFVKSFKFTSHHNFLI